MGSYENIVKIEEMRKRMEEGDAASAQKVLDTMEIKKIKSMSDLSLMAEVYAENEKYEEAVRLFLKIYEKTKSRKSLFYLLDLSIRIQNIEDARYYLGEYQKLAPKDFYKYIFRYRIGLLSEEPYETLIETLETLKKTEYMEQWAYELAKTYYKAGMVEECIRECSDIILWFGEGVYVEKAKILRSYFSGEADKKKIIEALKRRAQGDAEQSAEADNPDQGQEDSIPADGFRIGAVQDMTEEESVLAEEEDLEEEEVFEEEEAIEEGEAIEEEEALTGEDVLTPSFEEADFEDSLRRDIESILIEEEELGEKADADEEPDGSEEMYADEGPDGSEEMYADEGPDGSEDMYADEETDESEEVYIDEEAGIIEASDIDKKVNTEYTDTQEVEVEETSAEGTETEEFGTEDEDGTEKEPDENVFEKSGKAQNSLQPEVKNRLSERDIAEQEVERALYQLLEEEDTGKDDIKLQQLALELGFSPETIFGKFFHIKSFKKQLAECLEDMLDPHTKIPQVIITGSEGSGKTTLAKDITMFLNQVGKLKSSKIAKIKADKLNTLDIMSKKEVLRDCCLVVEDASELKRETIDGILELCQVLHGNIAVILEENKININKLFQEYPKLIDLFRNRIHLPEYTWEDLFGFADTCLKQQGYRLSSKAVTILDQRISQIAAQPQGHSSLRQVDELMQKVVNAADIRTGRNKSDPGFRGGLNEEEMLTILPEDFVIKP